MTTKTLKKPDVKKINLELERYEAIINYFENNKDRIYTKNNQKHLTRLYASLLNQTKLNPSEFKDLSGRIHNLVEGPNYLLGHWEELRILENLN